MGTTSAMLELAQINTFKRFISLLLIFDSARRERKKSI